MIKEQSFHACSSFASTTPNATQTAALFDGWQETILWSGLQGHMGHIIAANGSHPPRAAQVVVGDFCFFAGEPDEQLVEQAGAAILVPRTPAWCTCIEQVWGNRVAQHTRYAIRKDPNIFDRTKLTAFAASLPDGYALHSIDHALYHAALREGWSKDLCSLFADVDDYCKRGMGVAVLYGGELVAGASSYSIYTGGIEIEIDTQPDHQRRGLATACGAQLILNCLARGLYPSWDAHDLRSVALAEKLGYQQDGPYPVYVRV